MNEAPLAIATGAAPPLDAVELVGALATAEDAAADDAGAVLAEVAADVAGVTAADEAALGDALDEVDALFEEDEQAASAVAVTATNAPNWTIFRGETCVLNRAMTSSPFE